MRDIKELTDSVKKYKNAIIQQNFDSKKNTVAYVTIEGKPRILKWFVPGFKRQMENEYQILKKGSSDLAIPHPYNVDITNNVISMNYISGENICDVINDENTLKSEKQRLVILLAEWFSSFHSFF